MEGKFLINNVERVNKDLGVTLVCCFSRTIFVPFFFKALKQMDLPRKDIHLLVYDNTKNEELAKSLKTEIQRITPSYKSVRLYKSYLPP
ncbi:unnamed protein product, partial [marine sediment metagenome]